jgi:two-component system LytT family response regulator
MAIRVVIVDDEVSARQRLRLLLGDEPDVAVVGEATTGAEAIRVISQLSPDLVYLDIGLPDVSGLEIVRHVRGPRMPEFVFVTGYDQYALAAFDVNAFDYLLKPYTDNRFRASLDRARERLRRDGFDDLSERVRSLLDEVKVGKRYAPRIAVRAQGRIQFVPVDDIDWIEADGKFTILHVAGEKRRVREMIGAFEQQLDPARFLRVHRSAIVNADRIGEIAGAPGGPQSIVLKDGTRIPLSRANKMRVYELAGEEA